MHALTKREMFEGRLGRFLRASGQIALDRVTTDRGAIRACLHVLEHGGAVGIFPEGNRGAGDLTRFRNGAAYLARGDGRAGRAADDVRHPAGRGRQGRPPGARGRPRPGLRRTDARGQAALAAAKNLVAATSAALHERMLDELKAGLASTGQAAGPIPAESAKEIS